MKSIEQIKQDPAFMALDPATRAKVLSIVSDEDIEAQIESLKQYYNEAEKRRDFSGMNGAQSQIKKLKEKLKEKAGE